MIARRAVMALLATIPVFPAIARTRHMTRMEQFQAVIDAWKRKDVEFIFDNMTDDVVWHYAAAIAPPARGKAEARAFVDQFGAGIGEVRWRIFYHSESGDRLFVEGVDEYTTKDGVDIAAPYAGVIEFRGDKISAWRDYVDRGVIDSQKAGNGWSPQVKELAGRPAQ
ncbi:MAG: nuclear transport factor 2 family protein [Tsuneonella sp.]